MDDIKELMKKINAIFIEKGYILRVVSCISGREELVNVIPVDVETGMDCIGSCEEAIKILTSTNITAQKRFDYDLNSYYIEMSF